MHTKDLIGRCIQDIHQHVCTRTDGLDEASLHLTLDGGKIIHFPWGPESLVHEEKPPQDAKSLFSDLSDIPVWHVNPQQKTVEEVSEAYKKRTSSFWGQLKSMVGLGEKMPREYLPFRVEYEENRCQYLQEQEIKDYLYFEDDFFEGYLELENGYIITFVIMAPHGTGHAGLRFYESLEIFEACCGREYRRLSETAP
ncbi:MAG: hypothetical protein AAFR61_04315 [Bacteroidota bacterium]